MNTEKHSPESSDQETEDFFKKFNTRPDGLSPEEAETRLKKYGPNEITEKHTSPFLKFLSYFWGPIPWMIEIAAILSLVVRHWEDFIIITIMLMLNAIVGFWQEYKADNAIELLKQRLALSARVLRDGKWSKIAARELVPGDIIRIRLGDIVPADIRLTSGDYLLADESALTGESQPVEKKTSELAYSGSVIRQGEMEGIVSATAMETFFGKTAHLVAETETVSHFQKTIIKIGNYLIVISLFLVSVIFLVSIFRHASLLETMQFALILTVAAIPAALPAVMSVTLAVGAIKLAKRQAIVSKLVAIEEMAGMDILCSDKTGTITQNKLKVGEILCFKDYTKEDLLISASLSSKIENQDPIDTAIVEKTEKTGGLTAKLKTYVNKSFTPFDPVSKRTEATVADEQGNQIKISKGAPQAVLSLVDQTSADKDLSARIDEKVDELAKKGFRPLGVARTDEKGDWQYMGIIALYDPPRKDSAETIGTATDMGVAVKMITGDHVAIAKEIARQVKMGTHIETGDVIKNAPESGATELIEQADGFAQVFPEHKFNIVERLQKNNHIVGMTGDGVNDAPALKKADVGIAVEGATDAAKSAADIVLTEPGLSVIIDAIKESRQIFQRMNSYAIYRITETIRVLLFITLSILAFNFYPITAIMIVLLALFNDAPIMAIAYDRVPLSDDPERWDMRIVMGMSLFLGTIGVLFSFTMLYIGLNLLGLSNEMIQSFIFLKLVVAGHLTIFLTRTRGPFWSNRPSGALFWSAVITKVLATLVAVYGWFVASIGWHLALIVWGYCILAFALTDYLKLLFYDLLDHSSIKFRR
ncbi:MAG: plasma-membrane proton-efflux P-type ATPase [Thermodesulfobacteriota bacterium]|nr:plasma-membrane proton-efflux P-type ATPase [Thermodesulfobacteriota bacterium]